MLDPMMYQLFLRTFRLKGYEEGKMLEMLEIVNDWLNKAIDGYEKSEQIPPESPIGAHITQAQRYYYGSQTLTLNGDYELAVLEMRRSITMTGLALLEVNGTPIEPGESVPAKLRDSYPTFYEQVMVEFGALDLVPKGVQRGIGEARFMAQRL